MHTFFDQLLVRGQQVILLLDGLDEVPNEQERAMVSQKIEDLVAGLPELKVIVTCRTAAYKDRTALGRSFREIQVQPLNQEQVAQLIRQAYSAVEFNPTICQAQADDLIAGIQHMEAERQLRWGDNADRLVTSPLMVRMLLIVHVSDRRLPEHRAELFQRAVDNMLQSDHVTDTAVRNDLGQHYVQHRELLQFLAFHMHQQGDKGREIDEQDMRRLLNGQEGLRSWVDNFIRLTRQRGTLLEERLGVYRFIHLGFQEFLAARYMDEVLGYDTKLAEFVLAEGTLFDSWWWEPLLLLVGYLSVTSIQRAERLVRFWPGWENWKGDVCPKEVR
ncbi:MAG: NACHT domain-containing protein [Chloroflexi bacterium]|nr:NACHT domain-containing protein [Chloroflexota bacterium]